MCNKACTAAYNHIVGRETLVLVNLQFFQLLHNARTTGTISQKDSSGGDELVAPTVLIDLLANI